MKCTIAPAAGINKQKPNQCGPHARTRNRTVAKVHRFLRRRLRSSAVVRAAGWGGESDGDDVDDAGDGMASAGEGVGGEDVVACVAGGEGDSAATGDGRGVDGAASADSMDTMD